MKFKRRSRLIKMNLENSLFKVTPKRFEKIIEIPTSKSYANRALIFGALKGNGFTVVNLPASTDVENLLNTFFKIGLQLEKSKSQVKFINSFPDCEKLSADSCVDLSTGDGGTTNRFLIAFLSRGKKTYRLFPSEKISERPIDDLLLPLKVLGVQIEKPATGPWLTIKGPANVSVPKKLEIDCSKSTQFATALLLSFQETLISFTFKNLAASEKYLDMTREMLKQTEPIYEVPADFSSLSYPAAMALTDGAVTIKNCKSIDPFQADSVFIDLITKSGGDIFWTDEGLRITSRQELKPFVIDGAFCPDLIPTLAFLASRVAGESRLENLGVLRHKESDRIDEIINLLKIFQVDFTFLAESSTLLIRGSNEKAPSVSHMPARDHRMVMTAYLFMRANSGGMLGNTDCVKKSYPNFLEDMN